ncbi:MAG: hypothetical protein ABIN79_05000 [Marmoricola sp.]
MAQRVVLHVGTMKSGTSYVQELLFANKGVLAERGVLVAGRTHGEQTRAIREALGHQAAASTSPIERWARLVEEIGRYAGTAVISTEFLGPAAPHKIAQVLESFDNVTVVVTARDLNRNLAAMWQETVQNGRSWSMADYLHGAETWRPRAQRSPDDLTLAGKTFWRQQNLVRLCRNWSAGPARLVVVTVPPPGAPRETLRDRFLSVLGTTADGLTETTRANESIGAASVQVLRRLNELLDAEDLEFPVGASLRKSVLAKSLMAGRRTQEPAIGLPVAPWVGEYAEIMVAKLGTLDVDLVGDWADLTPVAVPGADPATIPDSTIAEAAVSALAGVVAREIRGEGQYFLDGATRL